MSVIIDNGSYSTRAGFITDQKPRFSIPTSIERKSLKQDLTFYKSPIQNGKIIDWDIMETLWHRIIFELLQVQSSETSLTMTCNLFASKKEKEKMTQIMFETFEVSQLSLQFSSVSSLISTGRTSGLVVDCGYQESFIVPVFEGYRLQNQTMHLNVGGKTCSEYLLSKILQKNPYFNSINKISIIEHIKENLCYTNNDKIISQNYQLPDGSSIQLDKELIEVPEVMFQPYLVQVNQSGIQDQYQFCIKKSEVQAQIFLLSHTVLAGGNSRYKGFYERFIKEIKLLFSENQNKILQIVHSEYFSSWIGCAIAQQTKIYNQIARSEYDEYGPNIIERKIF